MSALAPHIITLRALAAAYCEAGEAETDDATANLLFAMSDAHERAADVLEAQRQAGLGKATGDREQ